MLEHVSTCIINGRRSFLTFSHRVRRHRRHLHAGFWCHGATEIDLPLWWTTFLQQSQADSYPARTTKSLLTSSLSSGHLLEFLYPPKTLSLFHHLSSLSLDTIDRRRHRRLSARRRLYSSEAAVASISVRGSQKDDETLNSNNNSLDYAGAAHGHLKILRAKSNSSGDPTGLQKCLSKSINDVSSELGSSQSYVVTLLHEFVSFNSELILDRSKRLLSQLHGSRHDLDWGPDQYNLVVKAHVLCGEPEKAMAIYQRSLEKYKDQFATPTVLRMAVETKQWQLAVEAWDAFNSTMREETYFWTDLKRIQLSTLFTNALELTKILRSSKHNADTYLQKFAIRLIEEIFSIRGLRNVSNIYPWDYYKLFLGLRDIQNLPTLYQYGLAIRQCLSISFRKSDPRLRQFGVNAIRLYMALRTRPDLEAPREIIEPVFKRAVQIHNVDTEVIFNDFREKYGLTKDIIRRMLSYYLFRQESKRFYLLLDEAKSLGYNDLPKDYPSIPLKTLRMHAGLKESNFALATFNSIREQTGKDPDLKHWAAVVRAFALAGDPTAAKDWITKMKRSGIEPDIHTYIPLIKYYARTGDLENVKQLLSEFERRNFPRNVIMFQSMIHAHLENENLDAAEDLLIRSEAIELEGDRTHMWNLVLGFFAVRRGLPEVNFLRQRMIKAGVKANEHTYAALASALCTHNLPSNAFRFLANMQAQGKPIGPFHMSQVMAGFIRTKQYEMVFNVYRYMFKRAIAPDAGVKALLITAAAKIDEREAKNKHGVLERAEEILDQVIKSSQPNDTPGLMPIKGIAWDDPSEAFASNYFGVLMTIYGRRKMFKKVDELFNSYIEFAGKNTGKVLTYKTPGRTRMVYVLMNYHLRVKDFETVDQLWEYMIEKARQVACRDGKDPDKDRGWVWKTRRYILAAPLVQYMGALAERGRTREIPILFKKLQTMGFEIDNNSRNTYVQLTALAGDHIRAFRSAEKHLMPGYSIYSPKIAQPLPHELGKGMPSYKTLVTLGRSYLRVCRESEAETLDCLGPSMKTRLGVVAPKTIQALRHLPKLDDEMQRMLLS